ncbi:2165_t:CDS:2, partial [Funneliformis mosseae]
RIKQIQNNQDTSHKKTDALEMWEIETILNLLNMQTDIPKVADILLYQSKRPKDCKTPEFFLRINTSQKIYHGNWFCDSTLGKHSYDNMLINIIADCKLMQRDEILSIIQCVQLEYLYGCYLVYLMQNRWILQDTGTCWHFFIFNFNCSTKKK